MHADLRFARVVILVGCLVVLGLNTAAQGLDKLSPDISQGFLELALKNQVFTITALGMEYQWDTRSTMSMFKSLKLKAEQIGAGWKQKAVFWESFILERIKERIKAFLSYQEERFRFIKPGMEKI